jgi:predicted DCC family thiol-disulfide oxidoreductase YuxK
VSSPAEEKAAGTVVVYDGDCPFCRNFVSLMRLRETIGPVSLINARDGGAAVDRLLAERHDLNEGMAVIFGGKVYYGDDAVTFIASMTEAPSFLAKAIAVVLRDRKRAEFLYPMMKAGRRLTLRLLGVPLLKAPPV